MRRAEAPEPGDAVLAGLLELVGPARAGALLRHLSDDLAGITAALDLAAGPPADTGALGRALHALAGLAGTCGAQALHARAQALQALCAAGTEPAAAALDPLRRDIAHLRRAVAARQAVCSA